VIVEEYRQEYPDITYVDCVLYFFLYKAAEAYIEMYE
jgi:hypothetical protein